MFGVVMVAVGLDKGNTLRLWTSALQSGRLVTIIHLSRQSKKTRGRVNV